MKNNILIILLLVLFFNFAVKSQTTSFLGFDHSTCSSPMLLSYTYTSSPLKIYKNGVEVYDFGYSRLALDLKFIDDSTGFLVYYQNVGGGFAPYTVVQKTSDYGNSWTLIGISDPGYKELYVINKNYAYLVCIPASIVEVTRCSDIDPPSDLVYPPSCSEFICDYYVVSDIYKLDTIMGESLCFSDSLIISVLNSSNDTIKYHINWSFIPVGIEELPDSKPQYIIYPNPAENKINIIGEAFVDGEIISIEGKKVKEFNSFTVDVDDLSEGVYIIKIQNSNQKTYSLKFCKI